MKPVFRTGRYANVTATMALVVALGGTSYAATSLAKNSVGSGQLKRGSVANSDLRANAVTSGKVKNGALLLKDFKTGQIPAGPRGATGATGAAGAPGAPGAPGGPGPAGTARAYAHVTNAGAFVAARTKGFTAVTRPAVGTVCLTPAAGIDPATTSAVVSPEFGQSAGLNLQAYVYASAPGCPAGDFQVTTVNGGAFSNATAFTIIVP